MTDDLDPQAILEQFAPLIATFTGVKQNFIDQGWTPEVAERMTLEMLKMQVRTLGTA